MLQERASGCRSGGTVRLLVSTAPLNATNPPRWLDPFDGIDDLGKEQTLMLHTGRPPRQALRLGAGGAPIPLPAGRPGGPRSRPTRPRGRIARSRVGRPGRGRTGGRHRCRVLPRPERPIRTPRVRYSEARAHLGQPASFDLFALRGERARRRHPDPSSHGCTGP